MAQPKIPRGRMLKVDDPNVKGVRFNTNGTVDVVLTEKRAKKRNPKKKRKVKAKGKPVNNRKSTKKKRKAAKRKK